MSQNTTSNEGNGEKNGNPPAIRACLFDMDGLLIDSEDIYTLFTNQVLREYGKPDLPWHIKAQMQGRPGPEAGEIFSKWAQLPIPRSEFYAKTVPLQQKYFPTTKALPGVPTLLKTLHHTGAGTRSTLSKDNRVHIALATSSHATNFTLKSSHLEKDIFYVFDPEHRVLGDDPRIPPGRGKPCPDIYLLALQTINARLEPEARTEGKPDAEIERLLVKPAECLVFEDSVPGVEAGRRAGMQVVWCPHPGLYEEFKDKVPQVLAGRTDESKEKDQVAGKVDPVTKEVLADKPGEIGDGWARYFLTLEDFPYSDYGIVV